jgi:hypothetical protein
MESIDRIEATSEIHSIVIQHLTREMHYSLGQKMGDLEIVAILVDENYYHLMGALRYLIYAKKGDQDKLWKSFMGLPVSVTYKI